MTGRHGHNAPFPGQFYGFIGNNRQDNVVLTQLPGCPTQEVIMVIVNLLLRGYTVRHRMNTFSMNHRSEQSGE